VARRSLRKEYTRHLDGFLDCRIYFIVKIKPKSLYSIQVQVFVKIKQATFLALLLVNWVDPQCENEKTEMIGFIARDQNDIE